MRNILLPILALLTLGACQTSGSLDLGGRGSHAILVVAEDGQTGSVSRNSRISGRVLNGISEQINAFGFSVFDETALTCSQRGSVDEYRDVATIVELARSSERPMIDTVALFTVFTESDNHPHTKTLRVRVASRLIGVRSGRQLGGFEAIDERNIHPRCAGSCYRELVSNIAGNLGREVAEVLGRKLNMRFGNMAKRQNIDTSVRGLTLSFDNFNVVEMRDIEEYLQMFSGYRSHRPVASYHRHMEFWYETSITQKKLQRNLDRMFEEMGVEARVTYQGDAYKIAQLRVPERARRHAPGYRW